MEDDEDEEDLILDGRKFDPAPYQHYKAYGDWGYKMAMSKQYDGAVRKSNMIALMLSLLSISLSVLILETTWLDAVPRDDGTGIAKVLGRWDAVTASELVLKILQSLITVVLLVVTVRYYHLQKENEHKSWFVPDSLTWIKFRWAFLCLEVVLCAIHPFPDALPGETRVYDNTFAVWVIVRMYTVVRVIRDFCPVYKQRAGIVLASKGDTTTGLPNFNWVLTTRYFFFHYMWYAVLFMLFTGIFLYGYGVFVLERTVHPEPLWTFEIALWQTIVTMTTVGYGDYSPTWWGSRACQILAAFSGILLSALLIFVIVESLDYSHVERRAYNRYKLHGISVRQRNLAAKFIQFHWRQRCLFRRDDAGRRLYDEMTSKERSASYKKFRLRGAEMKLKLKQYRRQQVLVSAEQRKHDKVSRAPAPLLPMDDMDASDADSDASSSGGASGGHRSRPSDAGGLDNEDTVDRLVERIDALEDVAKRKFEAVERQTRSVLQQIDDLLVAVQE